MEAFIARGKVKKCPGMFTPELAAHHQRQHEKWLSSVSLEHKKTLGFKTDDKHPKDELADLPPEIPVGRNGQPMTPQQIKKNAYYRERNRKKRLERFI